MKLRIVYGKAGSGKSEFCFNEISSLINKEKKIYIITPEQFSFMAEKKLMEAVNKKAVFNAEVISFNRMAYRVINEVGGSTKTQLSKCGKAMLIYWILSNKKFDFKFLGKTDNNVDVGLNAVTELKKHGVSVQKLQDAIDGEKDLYLQAKMSDIQIIYENFEKQIQNKYIDETDLLSILADNIDKTDMFKDSVIYIDEFMGFTSQEYEVIEKLLNIAKSVTITACTENMDFSTNPDIDIFYSNKIAISKIIDFAQESNREFIKLQAAHRFQNEELKHLEQNLYKPVYKKYEEEPENIKLFLAKNQFSEIEEVAQNIAKLIKNDSYKYGDIGIITKNVDTYSSLIKAIFEKYQIPVFIDEKKDLNQSPVVRYILSILEIFSKNWRSEEVLNYLKTGFLDIYEDDIFKFENYCTKWGIKRNKWKVDFTYGIKKGENEQEIEHLNDIRKQIVEPLDNLREEMNSEKTAENMSKVFYKFLEKQGFEEKLNKKINKLEEQGEQDVANEYKESYNIIIGILDEMVLAFKDDKMTFEKYTELLKIGLKNSGLGKIPMVADQVIVGDVERSRSHKVKAVFIIGLNDGVFPSVKKDEGFLNDEDRKRLKSEGLELAKGTIENLYEDNFNIYKAFTTAEEKLYLSYASADSEGKSLRASILISKIKRIYPNMKEESDVIQRKAEVLNKEMAYDELLLHIYELQSGKEIGKVWNAVYEYYKNEPKWKLKLKKDLQGLKYSNLPEKISQENVDKLYGNVLNTSISRLEKYRSCPFSYYLQYGLKLKEKDELKVKTLDTGTFMHEVIDEFFDAVKKQGLKLEELENSDIEEIVNKIIEENLTQNKYYIFTSTAKYRLLVARLKRIIVKSLKYIVQSLVESRFEILGTEVEFGEGKNYAPIKIELENGKKVQITGKIDRIDVAKGEEKNYLRIIDYKSSAKNIDLNEVYAGLQIQLLTYLDAVCKEEDLMPAGVLYFNLLEQMAKADRKLTEAEIEERIRSNFKMKGLILADVKVVKLHDKNLESGASKLVPAYIDKSGNLGSRTNGVTSEQFSKLQKYMHTTIKEISKEILKGKIDLKPYYKKGQTPCKYCSYKGICGFNTGLYKNEYNIIPNKTKEEVLQILVDKISF